MQVFHDNVKILHYQHNNFQFHLEWEHLVGCVINDPLAIAYFIDSSICSGFDSYVQIETQSISIGQSIVDDHNFYRKQANHTLSTKTHQLLLPIKIVGKI